MSETFRCWAEIDQNALRHNLGVVRERVGGAEILAVVKANAYGHGLIGVAKAVAKEVQLFGVANLEEALAIRTTGLAHRVIILGPALAEERAAISEHGFIPTISAVEEAEAGRSRQPAGTPVPAFPGAAGRQGRSGHAHWKSGPQ